MCTLQPTLGDVESQLDFIFKKRLARAREQGTAAFTNEPKLKAFKKAITAPNTKNHTESLGWYRKSNWRAITSDFMKYELQ